jgi:hypothetical protein
MSIKAGAEMLSGIDSIPPAELLISEGKIFLFGLLYRFFSIMYSSVSSFKQRRYPKLFFPYLFTGQRFSLIAA